jgi:hypothetical protein
VALGEPGGLDQRGVIHNFHPRGPQFAPTKHKSNVTDDRGVDESMIFKLFGLLWSPLSRAPGRHQPPQGLMLKRNGNLNNHDTS